MLINWGNAHLEVWERGKRIMVRWDEGRLWEYSVDGSSLGLCPMVGFGLSNIKPWDSAAIMLVK